MPQAVITVAGITPPGPGKKQGKITDTNGGKWNAWGDKLANYRMGVSYEIVYEEDEYEGHPFRTIKTANPTNAAPAPQPAVHGQYAAPPAQVIGSTEPSFTKKDEMIFVCGALNNALSNPNVVPFQMTVIEIATFVKLLRQVWRGTLGATQQQVRDDMNDSVPF